jgi:peptidyl-prolyl cis-trans isomerase C
MSPSLSKLAIALTTTFSIGVASAQDKPATEDPSAKVATVNGKAIPRALLGPLLHQGFYPGAPESPQLRDAMREDAINRELLFQEAERRGLTKNIEVREQMELARQVIGIRALISEQQKASPINDDIVKSEYDRLKASMPANEYKARHILVEGEDEAKEIIAKLKKGAKFDELAKVSKDQGSKDKGGDLGWAVPTTYVKPFADALTKLEKGKATETPIQTQFGYHIIRLDDTRAANHPPLDQVKQQIAQRLQGQQIDKLVQDLRAKAKVQ